LIRLRLKLSEARPELVGRAQAAVTSLLLSLVETAAQAKRINIADTQGATFIILTVNAAFISAETVGNDAGVQRPDVVGITSFCLRGLGAEVDDSWFDDVNARLRLPEPTYRNPLGAPRGNQRTQSRRRPST
jgi:hypothetical protein